MNPENCVVCGDITQDGPKASWGPITLYFHQDCHSHYFEIIHPRLRDALVLALRRWSLDRQRILHGFQRSTTERESPDP